MALPYHWTFAVLCVFQGLVVAAGWRRRRQLGWSRLVGIALPVIILVIGVVATRAGGWSTEAVAALATWGAPVAAAASGFALGWPPTLTVLLVPLLFVTAWRFDGLIPDAAGVLIIGGACLTIAAVVAAFTSQRAIAAGLLVLAVVDSYLVFRGHIAQSTANLHAVQPPTAGGRPLPPLQDATFGRSLFGWLDILAPALAGMLFPGEPGKRVIAAAATAAAALVWGALLAVTDQIPGTVPPLAAVAVWFLTRERHETRAIREVTIQPARSSTGGSAG